VTLLTRAFVSPSVCKFFRHGSVRKHAAVLKESAPLRQASLPPDPDDVDLLGLAREIMMKMTPEERFDVQVTAGQNGVSEEYVVLEAILQLDLREHDPGEPR
jgi:hypothetical protein